MLSMRSGSSKTLMSMPRNDGGWLAWDSWSQAVVALLTWFAPACGVVLRLFSVAASDRREGHWPLAPWKTTMVFQTAVSVAARPGTGANGSGWMVRRPLGGEWQGIARDPDPYARAHALRARSQ